MTSSAKEKLAQANNKKPQVNPSRADFGKGEGEFVCILCQFHCHDNGSFQDHLKDHEAERPFKCSECEFRGKTKSKLAWHSGIHFAPKKYSCQFCKYKTRSKCHLNDHIRLHTKETPFKCDLCDYSSAYNSHLTVHKKVVHLRIREHTCFFCNANFGHRLSLEIHIRKHTMEKPFACHGCSREFAIKSSLSRHQRSGCSRKCSISNVRSKSLPVQCSVPQKSRKELRNPKALPAKPTELLQIEQGNSGSVTAELIRFKKLRVPVLLPLEILNKLPPGDEDPYAVPQNSNAEVLNPKTTPQSENPKTEIEVRAASEDPSVSPRCSGTNPERDGCQTMQILGGPTEAIPCRRSSDGLRTLLHVVPKVGQVLKTREQNLDNALNMALSIRREGGKSPYACAWCSFSCWRQDRLKRHCKRNHFSDTLHTAVDDFKKSTLNFQSKLDVRGPKPKNNENSFLRLNRHERSPGLQSEVSWSDTSPENHFLSSSLSNMKSKEAAHSLGLTRIVAQAHPQILEPRVKIPTNTRNKEPLDCDFCGKRFFTAFALLDHLRHHTGQQLYRCKNADCNFKTTCNNLYSIHVRNHEQL